MKNKLLSSAAGAALASILSGAAHAQMPNWTGTYIGAYAGSVWGHSDTATSSNCNVVGFPPGYYCSTTLGAANAALVDASGTGSLNGSGLTGGVQVGHNWQSNSFVYGFEADFGAFNVNGARQASAMYPVDALPGLSAATFTIRTSFDTDWLLTFRARFGWAVDNLLVFVTAGGAVTNLEVTHYFADDFGPPGASENASETKLKLGYALGAGIEWMVGANWTLKAEYLYLNFGNVTVASVVTNGMYSQGISTTADLSAHTARLGINFRF